MKYRVGLIALTAISMVVSPFAVGINGTAYAEEAGADELMTEGQLAELLVNVLGLANMLPPNPQMADQLAILLQNSISPKDGWNPENLVTLGNLARIMVQAMGDASKVENPESDKSWVDYLKSVGVEFGTIEEAIDQMDPMSQAVALQAVEVSTDPLRKVPFIRPADEQQLGADLQFFNRLISVAEVKAKFVTPPTPIPPRPPPVTPFR
ncbi:MAG TPA: hypothetical protein PJ991_02610 [Kiritimatiellia bacterium]|nr:hypothetical protein [Kiritimatiellia bacterium]